MPRPVLFQPCVCCIEFVAIFAVRFSSVVVRLPGIYTTTNVNEVSYGFEVIGVDTTSHATLVIKLVIIRYLAPEMQKRKLMS